jgi:hypothetical protein
MKIEKAKRSLSTWGVVVKVVLTAAFAFWFYLIWSSTDDLNQKLNVVSARYSAVHNVQVEYKNEVQEWKNLLLRSSNRETLDKNWNIYDAQYQKVTAVAQNIIRETDINDVKKQMNIFSEAHAANYEKYKNSLAIFAKSGFDPHRADAAVMGIDRPLLDYLEAADEAMQEESKNINERLTAKAKNQIDQSLMILTLIALLVIWMPKW